MKLAEYNKKRNFNISNEPKGKIQTGQNNSFVIQYHKARSIHYDFRLEYGGVLLSWAVPKGLSLQRKQKRLAVMVEDHPLDYISFEGEIPKGQYGAGTVKIFDYGKYVKLNNFKNAQKDGKYKFILFGQKLVGTWTLVKSDLKNWFIIKTDDKIDFSSQEIKAKNPFKQADVQLATLCQNVPDGSDYLFEIKYDGYRIMAFIESGNVKLISRNGKDYTSKFEQVATSLKEHFKRSSVVLDGEMVVFDKDGKSDFSLLQASIKQGNKNFAFVVFDVLSFLGQDVRSFPLIARKNLLKMLMEYAPQNLIYSNYVIGHGKQCFALAKRKNLEGVVAKKINSEYLGTRNEDWLKIKCYKRQEFVVVGYTTTLKNKILSSLVVGFYSGKELQYAGKVGTGFSEKDKEDLSKTLKKLETSTKTIKDAPKETIFVKPTLVAEIQFAEFTSDGLLRQPSFIGLREDKDALDVVKEESVYE